ncbi:Putative ATPase (AAA+ superfamily) [Umezakia ovalisporum]|uniref:ATP-binding protein n=1 Tax=Umezakia ovalisporum TaxID=75695 RepID=UPI0006EFD5A5|nr:Putative ATPase (AAA+ superfamily) [Umezakia ovalisporum]
MLPSVFKTCIPREEILAGELAPELFAAKLRLVVEGKAPRVYQDPQEFFANTFATEGLKTLISEVFGRLTGASVGSPIIRLETSFGGGKTHDEIALWHIAKNGRDISGLDRFADVNLIPHRPIQATAIACQDLDPVNGVYHEDTGITTYTLWGEIAYQIGGVEGYSLLKGSDEQRVSPGTVVLEKILQGQPTVVILDEIARYLRAAKATIVGNSDLAGQVVAFLFSLMDLAAACNNLVFVYTLASSSDSFGEETTEIREAISATSRQERILKPSTDIEIYNIVKQRIFSSIQPGAAANAAREYLQSYKASRINLPDGCKDARYAESIEQSYPFHPELFNLLTKKIASIPNFQRTRGALRLFAKLIGYLWQSYNSSPVTSHQLTNWIPLIHPHHIPVGIEEEITSDLTSRLERPLMRITIQADIYNPTGREAHAQLQDAEWSAGGKPPFSTWVARTIFLHSINQGTASGIRRAELNLSLLTPGLEIGFVDTVLERLNKVAWYLDDDPMTTLARFKEEPSINKIIAEEKAQVGIAEAKEDLQNRRDTIFANKFFKLFSAPQSPCDVDDVSDSIALCLIGFNEATISATTDGTPPLVERIFNETGESGKFRIFRNRLLFLVANKQELHRAIENTREFRAIENILNSPNRLQDLSESQQKQLKDKKSFLDLWVRVSLTNTYRHLFYPANDPVKAPKGLMHYTLHSQDSSDVKGKNNQQDVILKALKDCQKIRAEESPPYAPAYILQKVWPSGLSYWTTKALKEAFAKELGLNILFDAELSKLRDTIRRGLETGEWDMKMGEKVFIYTQQSTVNSQLPPIEFSHGLELYRRGILQPPKPREIELNAQVMSSNDTVKPVRVRWKAAGALTIKLYQDGDLVEKEFRPSDEYEMGISQTTTFKIVADYGNGEIAEKATQASTFSYGTGIPSTPNGKEKTGESWNNLSLLKAKPEEFEWEGTPNSVFTQLGDCVKDNQIQGIKSLELAVTKVMDYRKLMTSLALLAKFPLQIDQLATISLGEQFIRLEYQGPVKGFQSFQGIINSLLNNQEVQADVSLKLIFEFSSPVQPDGTEITTIKQALNRNPVDRLNLMVKVDC